MTRTIIGTRAGLSGAAAPTAVATVGATFCIIVFLSGWPLYSMAILGGAKALNYYVLTGAFAALVALLSISGSDHRVGAVFGEPLVWVLSVYLFVGLLWMQFSPGDPELLSQAWRARVLALLIFVSTLVLVRSAKGVWVARALLGVLVFDVALYWFDLAYPGIVVPFGFPGSNPGRAAGFHINANEAASTLLGTAIVVLTVSPMRLRGLVSVALLLGVAATISRSAIILSVLLVLFAARSGLLDRRQTGLVLASVPVLAVGFALFYAFMLTLPDVDIENVTGRLLWFATGGAEVDYSANERVQVARAALDMFLASPVLGHGFAATLRDPTMEPHNTYLMLAAEQGIVGLAIYATYLGLIVSRGLRMIRESGDDIRRAEQGKAVVAMGAFLAIQSLFSHNMLDQASLFVILASLLAINAPPAGRTPG